MARFAIQGGILKPAHEFQVETWINTEKPLTLSELRGKFVIVHAFQMLCPACTYQAIPQTTRLYETFRESDDVVVMGLHTVFEHHDVMTEAALKVFVKENRLKFPIGIDMKSENSRLPKTMRAYDMQGTPTLILIDKEGQVRAQHFGVLSDLDLGIAIGRFLSMP